MAWNHLASAGCCSQVRVWPASLGAMLVLVALGIWGCESCDECSCVYPDVTAPAAPRGLYSITGDNNVTLVWLANTEADLEGYSIWWNTSYEGEYECLATVSPSGCYEEEFIDVGVINSNTYYYAVTAFDRSGNESDFSLENVWDTPRPGGADAVISSALEHPENPENAGFDLSQERVVNGSDPRADFHYQYWMDTQEAFIVTEHWGGTGAHVLIQDMGWTADFDEIGFAPPDDGWSPSGVVEAIQHHTYVLLTLEGGYGYYAKIRLTAVSPSHIRFDWAFQADPWNQQLMAEDP
ncbi:MAG: hypothetical protein KAY24_16255 [Candidatus Eisenbacteria sp.]|nr:hypothetical protein [Candidatus Eisenbacteria bacterium]